jgi:hypothetical protein
MLHHRQVHHPSLFAALRDSAPFAAVMATKVLLPETRLTSCSRAFPFLGDLIVGDHVSDLHPTMQCPKRRPDLEGGCLLIDGGPVLFPLLWGDDCAERVLRNDFPDRCDNGREFPHAIQLERWSRGSVGDA